MTSNQEGMNKGFENTNLNLSSNRRDYRQQARIIDQLRLNNPQQYTEDDIHRAQKYIESMNKHMAQQKNLSQDQISSSSQIETGEMSISTNLTHQGWGNIEFVATTKDEGSYNCIIDKPNRLNMTSEGYNEFCGIINEVFESDYEAIGRAQDIEKLVDRLVETKNGRVTDASKDDIRSKMRNSLNSAEVANARNYLRDKYRDNINPDNNIPLVDIINIANKLGSTYKKMKVQSKEIS